MAIESPADIVILGLNRLSIEAGLYARFLGYQVTLLGNRFSVCAIGSEGAEIEFEQSSSSLGRMALEAQEINLDPGQIRDHASLEAQYVLPLAQTDLLAESCIHQCANVRVSMGESQLPEVIDEEVEYDTRIFELSVQRSGQDNIDLTADVLIDCRQAADELDLISEFDLPGKPESTEDVDDVWQLVTDFDDFYYLGEAGATTAQGISFGRGLLEIRGLFTILCDRPDLDLYKS